MKLLCWGILSIFACTTHAQELTISGTMHRSTLEGGCWYLQGDGGKKYELTGDTGLIYPLRIDGEHIVIRATPVKGAASVCMIGDIVRVLERIDTVRYAIDLPIMSLDINGTIHRTASGVWYVRDTFHHEYEFKTEPPQDKRFIGAHIHATFRVVMDRKSTRTGKDGIIYVPDSNTHTKPVVKKKIYDIR